MSKAERETQYPATNLVFWPGQEVMACDEHTKRIQGLNRAMGGAPLAVRSLEGLGEAGECSNCVNEGARG